MPRINCPDIVQASWLDADRVERQQFKYSFGTWARELAQHGADLEILEPMNSLVSLWIPFNSWLAQTIADSEKSEIDSALVNAAGRDHALSGRFNQLLQVDQDFRERAERFRSYWPIFRVRWLIENGISAWGYQRDNQGRVMERDAYRTLCFSKNPKPNNYRPHCYLQHQDAKSFTPPGGDPTKVPLNWAHTINAIYQVRCSLFHGGKSFVNSRDLELTKLAYQILWRVWGEQQFR